MSELTVARRYAGALYEEAVRDQQVEKVDADIELIRESLDGSRDLVNFFGSPVISREKKGAVVKALFADRVQPTTLRFLDLLVSKRREGIFPTVVQAYRELRDDQLGIVPAHARVALPLSEAEEKSLAQTLEKLSGKRVRLTVSQDADLLGGVVVRVGDIVYDGSVRNQLANLRERLEHGMN